MSHFDHFRFSRVHEFYMAKYFTLTLSKNLERQTAYTVATMRNFNLNYNFVVKCIHLIMDNGTSDTRNRAVPIKDFSFLPLNRKKKKNVFYNCFKLHKY